MKKSYIKNTIYTGIILIITALTANATTPKELFRELQSKIHSYKNDVIIPDLSKWKNQLDKSMNKDDLDKLNLLRKQAAELREKNMKEMKSFRDENMKNGRKPDKEEIKSRMKEKGADFKALAEQLKPIAEKYKSTLELIGKDAKPKNEIWRENIQNIIENWKNEHKSELNQLMKLPGAKEKIHGFKQRMQLLDGFKKKTAVVRFMLWDGNSLNPEDFGDNPNEPAIELHKNMITDLKNYPNPFTEKTTISFFNPVSQKLNLTIIDEEGKKIETLFDGKLESGQKSYVFNAGSLKSGSYFYKIKTDDFTKTGIMIINK